MKKLHVGASKKWLGLDDTSEETIIDNAVTYNRH